MESWGRWRAGGKAKPVLSLSKDRRTVRSGKHSLRVSFPVGERDYGIVIGKLAGKGFSAYSGLALWVFGDGSGLNIGMTASTFDKWRRHELKVDWRGWRVVRLPFEGARGDAFDPDRIIQMRIYVSHPARPATVYFDDLHLFGFRGDAERLEGLKRYFVRPRFVLEGISSRGLVAEGTKVKIALEIQNAWHTDLEGKLDVDLLLNEELVRTVQLNAAVPRGGRVALDVAQVVAVPGRHVVRLRGGPLGPGACDGFMCFTGASAERIRRFGDLTVRERDPVPAARFPLGTYTGGLGTRFPGWTLDRTLRRIRAAGFHPLVWNEFTAPWQTYEPTRGQYDWSGLDRLFGAFARAGLRAFPTFSFSATHAPQWMLKKFPDGRMMLPGGVPIPNALSMFHDGVLAEAKRSAAAVARRYKDNPSIIGYVVGNETGFNTVPGKGKERGGGMTYYGIDFNPAAAVKFRAYLRSKYGTIGGLNAAWRSDYADFNAIRPARRWFIEKQSHPVHWLDLCLFRFEYFGRYFQAIQQAMKAEAPHLRFACAGYNHTMRPAGIARGGYLPALRFADIYFQKWVGGIGASDFSSYPFQLHYARGMAGKFWVVELVGSSTPLGHGFLRAKLNALSWPQTQGEEYVRKVWVSIGCGAGAVLPAHWLPGANGVNRLVQQTSTGKLAATPALIAMEESNRFLARHGDLIGQARPPAARIALLDPMVTYILTAWDHNDPRVESADYLRYTDEARSFEILGKLLGRLDYFYDVIPQQDIADGLGNYRVLVLAGANHLYGKVARRIGSWVRDGGALVVIKQGGMFDEHCERTDLVPSLKRRWPSRVLTIDGFIGYPGCFASWKRIDVPSLDQYHALRKKLTRFLERAGVSRDVSSDRPDPEFHDKIGSFVLDHPGGHRIVILWSKERIGVVQRGLRLRIAGARERRYAFAGRPYPCSLLQRIEPLDAAGRRIIPIPELANVIVVVLTDRPKLGISAKGKANGN